MNLLPSAVHVSSTVKCGASGDWKMWFLLFSRLVPSPNMCIYVYYVIGVFVVCVLFCVVQKKKKKKKERRESS